MQIISAKPLIEKFRNGTFRDAEVEPYFMAYVILNAVVMGFAFGDPNPWDVAASFATVVITIFGVLHLKRQNGETFGNGLVIKFFALGWIISVRMILLSIPVAVVLFGIASILGGDAAIHPMGAILTVALGILFYWWLGLLISETSKTKSENHTFPDK